LPHGILRVFNTILYENEFQNPQIFQQTISLFHEQSTLSSIGNLQHIMMYTFFIFHPIVEIINHYNVKAIPKDLDYLSAALAFAIEGFLFMEHLHGRAHMNVQLHSYLIYTIFACAVSTVLEMININDARPALARSTFTLLQGTWFYQVYKNKSYFNEVY
jgi:hypothetical protein